MPLGDKIFLESGSMPELIKSGKMLWHRKKRGLKRFLLSTVLLWHILLVDPFEYLSSPRKSKHPPSQLAAAPGPDSTARTSKAERENMAPGQEAPAPPSTPSPGNEYSPDVAPLRMPHLEFIYRIVVAMDKDPGAVTAIPNAQGLDVTRMVLPIAGGTVRGPLVRGEIVKNSGADWAQRIANSSKVRFFSFPPFSLFPPKFFFASARHLPDSFPPCSTLVRVFFSIAIRQAQRSLHPEDGRRSFHPRELRGDVYRRPGWLPNSLHRATHDGHAG